MNFPWRRAPVAILVPEIGANRLVGSSALRSVLVYEVIQHPTRKLYPFAFDLAFDELAHCLIVAVIEPKDLFPPWSEFDNHVLCLVCSFRWICDDIDMNVSQIRSTTWFVARAVACLRHPARIDRGYKAGYRNLLAGRELAVVVVGWIPNCRHRERLRICSFGAAILLNVKGDVFCVLCRSASRTASVRRPLRTRNWL